MVNFIKGRTLDNGSQDAQILEQKSLSGLSGLNCELMIYRIIIIRNPSCSSDWVDVEPVSHLLYLPLCVPRAPPARVLKWGVSLRVPGADSPSLGEVVLRPLTAPSRLLSPRLGDLRARHASATAG